MPLDLYNTLTRRKDRFEPLEPGRVGLYVCGPTVYDFAHIGNARPVMVFDVLFRLLERLYPPPNWCVTYVRNITDVDDKIIKAAADKGETIETLTQRTAAAYQQDMAALGALPPTIEPRATQHIGQMIALIETLIAAGHAYAAEGHVLFNVPSMPEYGQLSRRSQDELVAGARVDVAPYKRDAADFILWKPSIPELPGWDSPWGRGRPGWHIECSAMSGQYLGQTFDIHGGGLDLIFPHHENEIAQSRCAHGGAALARVWMHNGFVTVNGDKMSKSLGNFFTVRQLRDEGHHGETIRLALLNAHYRQPLDFSRDGLHQSKAALDRWYTALRSAGPLADGVEVSAVEIEDLLFPTLAALEDDLNTPLAFSHLHELAGQLNKSRTRSERSRSKAALLAAGALLGVLRQDPELWFQQRPQTASTAGPGEPPARAHLSPEMIEAAIEARTLARQAKNFAEADRIRKSLAEAGIILEDATGKTTWKRTA